jgi:hypothetical protein
MSSKEMPELNNGSAAEKGGKEGADKEDLQEVRELSAVGSRRHFALVWKSEEIGAEVHNLDQFIRVDAGEREGGLGRHGDYAFHFRISRRCMQHVACSPRPPPHEIFSGSVFVKTAKICNNNRSDVTIALRPFCLFMSAYLHRLIKVL